MKKLLKKGICAILMAMIMLTTMSMSVQETSAAQKSYGDSLKLNNEIKLNKTSTYTKTGIYQDKTFFPKKEKTKIKYTIKCSRKTVGKNYKVTYKVTYKYLDDPKLAVSEIRRGDDEYDWYYGFTCPRTFFTVFNYQTGKSLEIKNDLGVTVKDGESKITYYPKQTYKYEGTDESNWYRNYKTKSYSFTVTYPKICKDVCVGIGFSNKVPDLDDSPDDLNNQYWEGKVPFGKTTYYKNGKNSVSYMRLK